MYVFHWDSKFKLNILRAVSFLFFPILRENVQNAGQLKIEEKIEEQEYKEKEGEEEKKNEGGDEEDKEKRKEREKWERG